MLKALLASTFILATAPAYAGCIGGSIGEGCIGIPTPEREHYDRRPVVIEREHRSVVVHEHHRRAPVVIEHEHEDVD